MSTVTSGSRLSVQTGEVIYLEGIEPGAEDGMFSEDGAILDIPIPGDELEVEVEADPTTETL